MNLKRINIARQLALVVVGSGKHNFYKSLLEVCDNFSRSEEEAVLHTSVFTVDNIINEPPRIEIRIHDRLRMVHQFNGEDENCAYACIMFRGSVETVLNENYSDKIDCIFSPLHLLKKVSLISQVVV